MTDSSDSKSNEIEVPSSKAASIQADRVPWKTIFAYGAPGTGAGYMYLLVLLYVMKFSTDVLLIAPAVMGIIFSASRIWDAISDPVVGYLSDKTTLKFGRRRSWILGSIVPIAVTFVMVFSPPAELSDGELIAWMAVAIIGFYSAMTLFFVPHLSLGAELSVNYHERSRLFGMRHTFYTFGSILSLITMYFLIEAEIEGSAVVRETARELAIYSVIVMAVLTIYMTVTLDERKEFQGRLNSSAFEAFSDVWKNHHARLLILVTFIENIGAAAIGVLTLYVAQYVVGAPQWSVFIVLSYMVPSAFSVPLWIPLSRRIGKIRLWIMSMYATAFSFGGMFFLPFIESTNARLTLIITMAIVAGTAAGVGGTVAPSLQGDVIDYDEYKSGERKEGSYFAAWNFVYKGAMGVMLLLTGFILEYAGFVPNQEQSFQVKMAMVSLYGLFPLVCYIIGALLFSRFKLTEKEHTRIRAVLQARAEKTR
jgi:GPH family glycoside/pentoside/hexuronide:cation symporter